MSSRVNRSNEFEDQDYYPPPPRRGEDARDFRRPVSPSGRSPPRERERGPPLERERIYEDVRLRDREASRGPPAFLREDGRRPEPGPMVLRKREVETIDRHDTRPRGSPSPPPPMLRRRMSSSPPPRMRRGRSPSPRNGPPPEVEHLRARFVETERVRSPSEVRSRRSPSRGPRFDDRRPRSLSPPEQQCIRTRIIDRSTERDIYTSSSSSPSPPPQRIRGPTLERDVITHYHDIDHGMVQARPPSPQRAPRPRPMPQERTRDMPQERTRADETDIDISLGRNRTEVDVVRRTTRSGSRGGTTYYHDDDLGYERYGRERSSSMRMGPTAPPMDDEAREITTKIDSRGRMGESWGGATKDWTIVDVPPGTERVRMDGKGGGSTDTTWSKYSGVRRTQFIPERDGALVPVRAPEPAPAPLPPTSGRDRLSVSVQSRNTDVDIERTTERRLVSMPPPPQQPIPVTVSTKTDMWTEITKDLVTREAIERLGYPYEESKWHFYIMDYLQFDQVKELTDLTDQIRRSRMRRAQKPREVSKHHDDIDVHYHRHRHYYDYPPLPRPHRDHRQHHHHHHGSRSHWDWEAESYREREVIWDSNGRKWYR